MLNCLPVANHCLSSDSDKSFWTFTLHFTVFNVALVKLTNFAGIPHFAIALKSTFLLMLSQAYLN